MEKLSSIKELFFDEERHRYKLRSFVLPSVTQIMQPMAGMVYGNVDSMTLSEAADRGTRAHGQIESIVKFDIEETDEDTVGYIEAFKAFCRDKNPVWIESEYRTFHKGLMYAGTADLIGYVGPDDGTGFDIIDLKCTSKWHPVLLRCQVSAYAEAMRSHGIKIRGIYGLQLMKDRSYRFERLQEDFKIFLHNLAIYNAMAEELKN